MAAKASVDRADWTGAALRALRRGGIDAVAVEALARELGVTKGSFYWHFTDRGELLNELLCLWEQETKDLITAASGKGRPLECVLWFFELVVRGRGQFPDMEYFSWARRDSRVAQRADATELKRIGFIRDQLLRAGVDRAEALQRAEAAYLATLGWIERASRTTARSAPAELRRFTNHLFRSLFEGISMTQRPVSMSHPRASIAGSKRRAASWPATRAES